MSISKFIVRRTYGHDHPRVLQLAERTRRTYAIDLSQTKSLAVCHRAGVHALDIDPAEGRYLLTGSQDKSVAVYDTYARSALIVDGTTVNTHGAGAAVRASGPHGGDAYRGHIPVLHRIPRAHNYSIETVQWYPHDNGLFVTSGSDGALKLWDANTMQPALTFADFAGSIVYHHSMSPVAGHGLIAVGGQTRTVKLVDPASGSATHELSGHRDSVLSVAWSPTDEFTLVSGSRDNTVMVWDVRAAGPRRVLDQHNGERHGYSSTVVTSHTGACNGVAFTPDGRHIISTGTDSRVRLWRASDYQNLFVNYTGIVNMNQRRMSFCVSPRSNVPLLFHPSRAEINVYDLMSGTLVRRLRGHYGAVKECIFHPDVEEVYSGAQDTEILVWSPRVDWADRPSSRHMSSSAIDADAAARDEWSD
eukprot:m.86855 g.86855  ORF g.86855 m.86855 type:complete len:418 (+) comp9680_c0_seq1:3450-4703(+)